MKMNFDELAEFKKERKRLKRRYRSLDEDLETLKSALAVSPLGSGKRFNAVAAARGRRIVKARLACRFLKNDALRVIYSYFERERRIVFIEIYFKGDKENENRARIQAYLKSLG